MLRLDLLGRMIGHMSFLLVDFGEWSLGTDLLRFTYELAWNKVLRGWKSGVEQSHQHCYASDTLATGTYIGLVAEPLAFLDICRNFRHIILVSCPSEFQLTPIHSIDHHLSL